MQGPSIAATLDALKAAGAYGDGRVCSHNQTKARLQHSLQAMQAGAGDFMVNEGGKKVVVAGKSANAPLRTAATRSSSARLPPCPQQRPAASVLASSRSGCWRHLLLRQIQAAGGCFASPVPLRSPFLSGKTQEQEEEASSRRPQHPRPRRGRQDSPRSPAD
jgi:hypothetical protein